MKKIMLGSLVSILMIFSTSSFSKCVVHYNRTACSGMEKISYKKCKHKKECDKEKKATDLASCRKAATKSCKNRRLTITKMKVITATWEGKAITTESGKSDFCLEYAKRDAEFNHCN